MKKASKLLLLAGAVWLGACSDGSTAPSSSPSSMSVQGGGATAALTTVDTIRFSFTIDPSRTTSYYLGAGNMITFPAGSLCDVSSSYGPAEWDKPCAVAKAALLVNAKAWLDRKGHPRIDFDQHIRFVPSNDPAKWVTMTLTDWSAASMSGATILYCKNGQAVACIDESKQDPSLATYKDPSTGQMTRRIKHFSGYNVFSGQPCTPSPDDPDCIDAGGADMNRWTVGLATVRGGYMLAWA